MSAINPAPNGLQTLVTTQPRSRSQLMKSENLTATNGARFEATIQSTPDGQQASFGVYLDFGNETFSTTDIQLFAAEQEAFAWLDQHARSRGFDKYRLERSLA